MVFDDDDRILCGRCRTVVDVEPLSGIETIVRCPACGETDTFEAARREASQHTAYALLQRALRPLKAGAARSATGSKPVRARRDPVATRS
jgi:hypothetical protein